MTEQELLQIPEELRELFRGLEEQGFNPQMCDVPILHFDNQVVCGAPTEVGDIVSDDFDMMPHDLATLSKTFSIDTYGDSMEGENILHGNRLEVLVTPVARNGDIVVASMGDGYTVKGFYVDDYGRSWLTPANDKYKPMLITEERRVHIEGRVISVRKMDPRANSRRMRNAVMGCEEYTIPESHTKANRAEQTVRHIAAMVKQGRQWYAVYRALVDKRVIEEDSHVQFTQLVRTTVPDHANLPVASELRRMEVQSFRRAVRLWDEEDAPVSGARFEAYVPLVTKMTDEEYANLLLTLCHQTDKMMCAYLRTLEERFVTEGGIKERMYAARTGYYRQTQDERKHQLEEENAELRKENAELRSRLGELEERMRG